MGPEMEVFIFPNYIELHHTSTILWPFIFFILVSPLRTHFPLTMVVSSFGPYHCLRSNDAPAKCAGVAPTPWAMMPTLAFVSYHRGHVLLVTPPPTTYLLGFFSSRGDVAFPPWLLLSLPSSPLSLPSCCRHHPAVAAAAASYKLLFG